MGLHAKLGIFIISGIVHFLSDCCYYCPKKETLLMIRSNTLTFDLLIAHYFVDYSYMCSARCVLYSEGSTKDQAHLTQLLIGLDLPEQVS
jgi:hypothetical protein